MSSSTHDTINAMYAACQSGDNEALKATLHPDVRLFEAESLPYGGTAEGPDEFARIVNLVFNTWEGIELTFDEFIGDGDTVMVMLEMKGKGKSTGKHFTCPIAELFHMKDGKILDVRPFYFDTKMLHEVHFA